MQWVRLVRTAERCGRQRGHLEGGCGKQETEGGVRGRCDWRGRGLPQWARQTREEEGVCQGCRGGWVQQRKGGLLQEGGCGSRWGCR